jgi:chemotaxis signal transduction protein
VKNVWNWFEHPQPKSNRRLNMTATAWIISITPTLTIAVGEFELVHILPDRPALQKIPKSPAYCEHVLVWENKIIPVMDLSLRFEFSSNRYLIYENTIIGIVAYRTDDTGKPGFGAFFMNATPHRIDVSDSQASDLPESFKSWKHYVISSFKIEEKMEQTVIIRLNRLFLP